ncbi:MalY/PatB family protein [Lactococcus allomyrinae]|uniref:cysteine-S-conjugate beta-lyase n=1 Tax=Lactococcus allomyrinae TaxID=2419773 RepID=A0A387BFR7_9LACT|nr:MalY/PatB family protein [Lactococcus allomyrinae]AYG00972.1 pyridoxal phosphate-dependent aminotransferase [Lactococcus allomyrinae]
MTKYDFTTIPNRLNHHSVKWKEVEKDEERLPLWVADMDFIALPKITEAIHEYADYGVYGYSYVPEQLLTSIQHWESTQHGYDFPKEAIVLADGVVPAIGIAVQALTEENDAVLINTPVYPPFARTVKLNQRQLVENSLTEINGEFVIDFEQLERDIIDHEVKLYILCNPHNPGGRVWRKDELQKIGELCQKHHVILVSDEIHQDLVLFDNVHHSFNTLSPEFKNFTIILSSATKTFNIAGTKCSFAIIENKDLREKFMAKRLSNNQHEINTLGMMTTQAALTNGAEWLSELKEVLENNINYILSVLTEKTKIKVMKPQGTYLIWLDFSEYSLTEAELQEKLHNQAKVILNKGNSFGIEGTLHARLNAAAPFEIIKEATERIVKTFVF